MKNKFILIVFFISFASSLWAQLILNSEPPLCFGKDETPKINFLNSNTSVYAANSVLALGKFVKIRITDSGVYKLTFEDLTAMGINPENVRIFGYGGGVLSQSLALNKYDDLPETSIWMEKGTDGVFNAGDYILFYAQGINRWSYDTAKGMFAHQSNPYSKHGYYFVTSDAGTGKKIMDKTVVLPESATIHQVEEFVNYQVYEKDSINLTNSGKEFYGEKFDAITSYDIPFTFSNPVRTNSTTVRLDVAASSTVSSVFTLSLNKEQSKTLNVQDNLRWSFYEKGKASSSIFSFTPTGESFEFNLNYNKPNSYSIGYLNYIEVNARCQLKMVGSAMPFQNVDYVGTNSYAKYMLSDTNANIQIWDITDPTNIGKMVTENIDGKMTFVASASEVTHYIAINPTDFASFAKPEIIGTIPNQNLHGITQADMVIITHPYFIAQAETLAQAHIQKDNMTVAVVTTDQVYNEFSSGTPDATAYRRILKMLYDKAIATNTPDEKPKYLLLFGRGSFDNRKILTDSGDNLVLTYQADNSLDLTLSYVTDDYFTLLDDNDGVRIHENLMDMSVGRFPVSTVEQATNVVNKTIGYMNNTAKGFWKNNVCFLADDGDNALHAKMADSVAAVVGRIKPDLRINKIFMDTYQQEVSSDGESYPEAKSDLMNLFQSGLMMFNFSGRADPLFLTNEKIITDTDISDLTNEKLPLWVVATSDFSKFDAKSISAGEKVLLNPTGGGIGVFSSSRLTYATRNFDLNRAFCSNLFKKVNGTHPRIGDVIRLAKNQLGNQFDKLTYIYLGDPALKLNFPSPYNILTTQINNSNNFGTDTLKSMSNNTIQGIIVDQNGNQVSDFNGKLNFQLFDKIQQITTLNNDKDGAFTYSDRPMAISSGDVQVVAGAFSIPIIIPKDINLSFGSGRIIYYAQDENNHNEAQGYFENFIIGGTDLKNSVDLSTISTGFMVSNLPNPFKTQTRFAVNYSNPETIENVIIEIYDLSGRKIKTINQSSLDNLTWDLSTSSNKEVSAGVYVYRIVIKSAKQDISSGYNKLIVVD